MGIGWEDEIGRQQLELLYSGNSIDPENKYLVSDREDIFDMFMDNESEAYRKGTVHFGKIPMELLKLLAPHQIHRFTGKR